MKKFSDSQVQKTADETAESGVQDLSLNKRVGADSEFDEQKHAYVLTFPWNFEEVV